jgi:hypothetical protein
LRDRLTAELNELNSAEQTVYLGARSSWRENTLTDSDAECVGNAFQTQLMNIEAKGGGRPKKDVTAQPNPYTEREAGPNRRRRQKRFDCARAAWDTRPRSFQSSRKAAMLSNALLMPITSAQSPTLSRKV